MKRLPVPCKAYKISKLTKSCFVPGRDARRDHPEERAHVVEDGEGDKGRRRSQLAPVHVKQREGGETEKGHQEDGAIPKEALQGLQEQEFAH